MNKTEQILSSIDGNPFIGLQKADELWTKYKSGKRQFSPVITYQSQPIEQVDYDVAICGVTLGILLGAALA